MEAFLKESFGQPLSFKSIAIIARAAKFRVRLTHDRQRRREGRNTSMTSIKNMSRNITFLRSVYSYLNRANSWSSWYDSSFAATLLGSASCPGSRAELGYWPKLNRHTLPSCPVPDPLVSEYK